MAIRAGTMEDLEVNRGFWNGRSVFLTGHTGFKGSWLSLWLISMGARVAGYALPPATTPNLFEVARVGELLISHHSDVRDYERLASAMQAARPEIVFHLAAQPLVLDSYNNPVETYSTNIMGTVHLLEAVRQSPSVRAVVNVTTDKCYENREWVWGYRENDPLGGDDPYSSSKACSELVTSAYRSSFFNSDAYSRHGVALASARAGNVIGGGDWAKDRLIPDCMRSLLAGEPILIRNPHAIRPWQHVLEPLRGYLMLAQRLFEDGPLFAESWNFGSLDSDARPVEWVVNRFCDLWGSDALCECRGGSQCLHEACYLKLDCSKAHSRLNWKPFWNLDQALQVIVDWVRAYRSGYDMRLKCLDQIRDFCATTSHRMDSL